MRRGMGSGVGLTVVAAITAVSLGLAAGPGPAPAPDPRAPSIVLISIDGLRPDLLLRADTPALHALMKRGSFSMWARTTANSRTLPSHVSMLTGVQPLKHGIDWDVDLPLARPIYPEYPTVFELAKRRGYTTAMAVGKSKFKVLARPGALSWWYVPGSEVVTDAAVTDEAVRLVERRKPKLLFVHLPGVDTAGHDRGWGSVEQFRAIQEADRCVHRILTSLRAASMLESTVVFVTSDHGGAASDHGPDDPKSRTIPWIVAGPGIRRDADLSLEPGLDIETRDTFSTICWLLGIVPIRGVEGHAVAAIRDRGAVAR